MDWCSIYQKYLEHEPHNAGAWCKYAALGKSLGEAECVRAIFQLGIARESPLDPPEHMWKAWIDFELAEGQPTRLVLTSR